MCPLSEKESAVLENISRKSLLSQRDLAKATGLSLGLVNGILRKFIDSGYLTVSHLNKRKVQYLLTPQASHEATKRLGHTANETIRRYRGLHEMISQLLEELRGGGYRYFSLHGDGELRELVESIFAKLDGTSQVTLGQEHHDDPESVVLNLTADTSLPNIEGTVVHLLYRLEDRGVS